MNIDNIKEFLDFQNLDLRITKNKPRFIDQKCTPDVISFIAECILFYGKEQFTVKDIWKSDAFVKNTELIFGKPSPTSQSTRNEFDKFIAQPLDLLSYAGILEKTSYGRQNKFIIRNKNVLEFIALKDRYAYYFLIVYLKKVYKDSDFCLYIDNFFKNPNNDTFSTLKNKFEQFVLSNSQIGTRGSEANGTTEIRRIFTKAINPLALDKNSFGTRSGRLSNTKITYIEINYNKINFRDLGKPKDIARKDYETESTNTIAYNTYLIEKAKIWIKKNHPYSEIKDDLHGKTSHAHHIFPKNKFPNIAEYLENLIALTGGQHLDKAHPHGNTQVINLMYQCLCLKTKNQTIKESIQQKASLYSRENFIYVLNTGFGFDRQNEIGMNTQFDALDKCINLYYKTN